jgi:hypothetical protein
MASAQSNGRMAVIVAILAFVAGCWAGMGSDETGDPYCVVTAASAAGRPGAAPGDLVEPTDATGDDGSDGCAAGEPVVCGRYDGDGEERQFVSEECPD